MKSVAKDSSSLLDGEGRYLPRTGLVLARMTICLCFLQSALSDAACAIEADNASLAPIKIIAVDGRTATVQPMQSVVGKDACQFEHTPSVEGGEALVQRIAREEHADVALAVAVARQESGFRMDSISSAGAVGLMQLMPATARRFEVDICDPEDNVRGGVRYLKFLERKYANPLYVLAAYNAGEAAVEQNGGIPLYPETVRYISAVLSDLHDWRPLTDRKIQVKTAHQNKEAPDVPDAGRKGAWTQGFVLHVE